MDAPDPPKELHGIQLFHCPIYHLHLPGPQCAENREIARGKKSLVHRYRRRGSGYKFLRKNQPENTQNAVDQEVKESRQACVSCPGAEFLWNESQRPKRKRSPRRRRSRRPNKRLTKPARSP